jgi:hypothetical protein
MMIKSDYIMRLVEDLVRAILKLSEQKKEEPEEDYTQLIEEEVGQIIDMDPNLFFSLEPASGVALVQMGEMNTEIADYVIRAIYYEATLLRRDGRTQLAAIRERQADALGAAYELKLAEEEKEKEALESFFLEADNPDTASEENPIN